jgi:hypothetical protein
MVEEIDSGALLGCSGVTEGIFATNAHLKQLYGFGKCASLRRLEIPASVEKLSRSTKGYGSPGISRHENWC